MENAVSARIINSDEVQSVLRPKLDKPRKYAFKKNPLDAPPGDEEEDREDYGAVHEAGLRYGVSE